jgi:hypothetical protein
MEHTNTVWTCTNCNEQVEEQFEACWNCQHNRDGVPSQAGSSEAVETPIDKALTASACAAKNMTYAGRKSFHEVMRWGMFGDFGESFVNKPSSRCIAARPAATSEFFVWTSHRSLIC